MERLPRKTTSLLQAFIDFNELSADEIFMYSDASKNKDLGFGAVCQNDWMIGMWAESKLNPESDDNFIQDQDPSIAYLELYALVAGVIQWIHRFANKRVILFCDNESVVHMVNKSSSRCKNCMVLIRLMTLESMVHNVRVL